MSKKVKEDWNCNIGIQFVSMSVKCMLEVVSEDGVK